MSTCQKGHLCGLLLYSTPRRMVPAHQSCHSLHEELTRICPSPATCGWGMLPIFSIHRLKAQDPQKFPFCPTMTDDLIVSSSFLPHIAQYARGTLFCFLVAMSHSWSPYLLMSLCALYSTKLQVPKQ